MAIFEKHKLSAKDREFWQVLFLVVRDAQLERGYTTDWTKLSPLGALALGGEIDERPKDSVWWLLDDGRRHRLAWDFGAWKRDVRAAAKGLGVDDALRARNRTRWANALTVAAIASSVIVTAATAGAAATVIGPTAAAILSTVGTTVGATSAALRDLVGSSAEGLTLDEVADALAAGGTYALAPGGYTAPIAEYTPPERPEAREPELTVVARTPALPVPAVPTITPTTDEASTTTDTGGGGALFALGAIAAMATVSAVVGLTLAAARR